MAVNRAESDLWLFSPMSENLNDWRDPALRPYEATGPSVPQRGHRPECREPFWGVVAQLLRLKRRRKTQMLARGAGHRKRAS